MLNMILCAIFLVWSIHKLTGYTCLLYTIIDRNSTPGRPDGLPHPIHVCRIDYGRDFEIDWAIHCICSSFAEVARVPYLCPLGGKYLQQHPISSIWAYFWILYLEILGQSSHTPTPTPQA